MEIAVGVQVDTGETSVVWLPHEVDAHGVVPATKHRAVIGDLRLV